MPGLKEGQVEAEALVLEAEELLRRGRELLQELSVEDFVKNAINLLVSTTQL
jgi:hypothetical protein